jgi:hypothetical protein
MPESESKSPAKRQIVQIIVVAVLVAVTFVALDFRNDVSGTSHTDPQQENLQKPEQLSRPAPQVQVSSSQTFADAGRKFRTISDAAPRSNVPIDRLPEPITTLEYDQDATGEDEPDLPPRLPISGFVLNRDGEPLSGIEINARAIRLFPEGTAKVGNGSLNTRSGAGGFFRFESLQAGEYRLQTTATEIFPSAQRLVQTGNEQADLVLADRQDTVFVYGRVSDEEHAPLQRVRVSVTGKPGGHASTDEDGYYSLEFIPQSERIHLMQFRHPDYLIKQHRIEPQDFAESVILSVDVVMEAMGQRATVKGSLSDTEGNPVPGQRVILSSSQFRKQYSAHSATDGRFIIEKVAVGSGYRVQILANDKFQDYVESNLQVSTRGLTLPIILQPQESGSIGGLIVDTEGNSIPHFNLGLRSHQAKGQPLSISSDIDGFFYLDKVPAGALSFYTRSEPNLQVIGAQLDPGDSLEITLVLDWGRYALQGQVLDSTRIPVAAATVTLSWSLQQGGLRSQSHRKALADQDGHFLFTQLGRGRHIIDINMPGYQRYRKEVSVDGSEQIVEVQLEEVLP